jgi:hypothetical protein
MTFTWTYQTADGGAVAGQSGSQGFPTQADAETWIGETWRELLDGGVDAVLLREDDHVVYGPMSLHPAD